MGSKHSRANNAPLAAVPLLYSVSGKWEWRRRCAPGEATNAPTTQRAPPRGASLGVRLGTLSLSFSPFPYTCIFLSSSSSSSLPCLFSLFVTLETLIFISGLLPFRRGALLSARGGIRGRAVLRGKENRPGRVSSSAA